MIRHHASDATLLLYAAGKLPEALSLVVATHLSHCGICRASAGVAEAIGGALLGGLEPAPMASDAVTRALQRLTETPPEPPVLPAEPGLPSPLSRCSFGRWWPIGPGLRWRLMRTRGRAWAGLIRAQPGRSLPHHHHLGLELTCVISGAFIAGSDIFRAGDLGERENDENHGPRVYGDEPCLCVIASEGMQLAGMLGLVQRLLRL